MASKSRFFVADSSESEDTSDSGSQTSTSSADKPKMQSKGVVTGNRFAQVDSESESEEEDRVVKSAKVKQWEALTSIIVTIRNQLRIDDY